ncbi:MAG: hypothetical protein FWG98_08830 [Candidatus Cloacimonetes bacterium]|nr:hypothetical protein [Candidatus Cloacimonadota bacterium]
MKIITKTMTIIAILILTLGFSISFLIAEENNPEGGNDMDAEIIRVYAENMPASRFIGKKYLDEDRVEGTFAQQWGEWHQHGWFDEITKQTDLNLEEWFVEAEASIGLMRWKGEEPFEYWIGMFMPAGTAVPEGMNYIDFPVLKLGIGWVQGVAPNIYFMNGPVYERLEAEGFQPVADDSGTWWSIERYTCPRFTTPDENGNVILDHVYVLQFHVRCQSCYMIIDEPDKFGSESDGTASQDYCLYCYQNGSFVTERTFEEAVEANIPWWRAEGDEDDDAARERIKRIFPTLKRWKSD